MLPTFAFRPSPLIALTTCFCCVFLGCTPKRVETTQASSTIEDVPNEPVADAGTAAPVAESKPEEEAPPPSLTFVKAVATEGFSVMMPADPQVQRNEVALKKGKVVTVTMTSTVDNVVYSVTRAEYPESMVKKAGPAKMLAEVRSGLGKQLGGTASDEQDVELAGNPGQIFVVAGSAKMLKARSVLAGSQLYTLLVLYSGKLPVKADEFLGSLVLAPPGPKAPADPPPSK